MESAVHLPSQEISSHLLLSYYYSYFNNTFIIINYYCSKHYVALAILTFCYNPDDGSLMCTHITSVLSSRAKHNDHDDGRGKNE